MPHRCLIYPPKHCLHYFKGINVEVDGITPDMNEILREIRVEYEQIQVKNRDEAEEWYKVSILIDNQSLSIA